MEHIRIAALRPNLDALDSKQIKAVVTLIWPYSSSQRQFALLLAEPDFRLRRNKGQVRVRFSSTSARALATTGVGIGDEVVLSLHGAQFVQEGAVSTPGKSIDWELAYTQTVAVTVRRNGAEIAKIELVNAVPTPAPRSPTKPSGPASSPLPQWSSPAFLKRVRLSDGPLFEQPAYDPFADGSNDGHDKKRRRRSYRDWKAWTYTARTPSPEKEYVGTEEELDEAVSSPSRPPQLPKTPISPARTGATFVAADPLDDSEYVEETTIADSAGGDTTIDDGELQKIQVPSSTGPERPRGYEIQAADYDDLYAGPDDAPPIDSQYDFGGDTELNTEDEANEEQDDTVPDIEEVEASATNLATELAGKHEQTDDESEVDPSSAFVEVVGDVEVASASATEEDSVLGTMEAGRIERASQEVGNMTLDETVPKVVEPLIVVDDALAVTMPPPSLPVLHIDFAAPATTGVLTPIGMEPSSPNLRAVDSATLPLPSPFPGEQATSYFEHVSTDQQKAPLDGGTAEEEEPEGEFDYIIENSFFSSTNSSKGGGLNQDHETAFTPVRFTFGMDGAGWSHPAKPLDLSSSPLEDRQADTADDRESPIASDVVGVAAPEVHVESIVLEQPEIDKEITRSYMATTIEGSAVDALKVLGEVAPPTAEGGQPWMEVALAGQVPDVPASKSSNVIVLSSDVEHDESEGEEDEDAVMVEPDEDQIPEEETESESEHGVDSEPYRRVDSEAEADGERVDERQTLPVGSAERTSRGTTADIETETITEQLQTQAEDVIGATQVSAATSEVVHLDSPSADEGSDGENDNKALQSQSAQVDDEPSEGDIAREDGHPNDLQSDTFGSRPGVPEKSPAADNSDHFDDSIVMDVVQEPAIVVPSNSVRHVRGSALIAIPDTYEESPNVSFDQWGPRLGMDKSMHFIEDHDAPDTQAEPDQPIEDVGQRATTVQHDHPDIKMESIEDGSLYMMSRSESQDVPPQLGTDPATDLLVGIPENGHKLGELQFKSVPATAPARNTRSKAKSAASPLEEDAYVSRLGTSMRSTRSEASSLTQSPPRTRTRTRSNITPTRDATQTSPYSLRSQSKQLSPKKGMMTSQASARKSPRKLARRDTDFDIVPSQADSRDTFGSMFEPSQELGFGYSQLSQGRYSDMGYVKDSEDDTSHSEGSISTVRYSDDDDSQANTSHSGGLVDEGPRPQLKPAPADASQPQRQIRSQSWSFRDPNNVVSPSQLQQSPRRSPRLARSTFSPSPSPRTARTTRTSIRISSPAAGKGINEVQAEQLTPRATGASVVYPVLQTEGESHLRSSPPAPDNTDVAFPRSSPPPELPASAQMETAQENYLPTLNDTQQTAMEPLLSFQARQPDQSLITPELTQQTSATATLRSFDIPIPSVQTQPAPCSPALRTPLRRKANVTDPQSSTPVRTSSPVQQPSDLVLFDDQDATLVQREEGMLPSIGLSTPLAYYTPLRDLIYFLNRSSQFHSSSNPDILALCTSASTAPEKAKKGPQHWNTTLHISDLSVWPEVRTVNIFRAYQNALPVCQVGDVVLLRAFAVESRKREPVLRSADESSWCVWRFGKPVWGAKKVKWGELRAREEIKGPVVERGEGEWTEVEKLRSWYMGKVKQEVEAREAGKEKSKRKLRSSSEGILGVDVKEVAANEE